MKISREVFQLKKDHIATKAMKIFLDQSHESIGINDLCKEIEVSKRTFYKYFPSKSELLLEIDQRILIDVFIPEFSNLGNTKNGHEQFSVLIEKFIKLGFDQPQYYRFFYLNFNTIKTLILQPEFKPYQDFRDDYANIFLSIYQTGLDDGSIRDVKAFSCMNIMRCLNGMLLYILTDLKTDKKRRAISHDEIFSFADHALKTIKNTQKNRRKK